MSVRLPKRYRLVVVLLLALLGGRGFADSESEAVVKVAFLYNFFKFIEWPAAAMAANTFNLCLGPGNDLDGAIVALEGKTLNGMPLNVLRDMGRKDWKSCHMIFVGSSDSAGEMLAAVKGLPVVTVGDKANFIEQGGVIGLVRDGNRLSFEINLDAVTGNGVHISANLLKLARTVRSGR